MRFKKGDIVIVNFPFTDGSEFKKRPALVISSKLYNNTQEYLLMQITSKDIKDEHSYEIKDSDLINPLPLKSYLRIYKLFTIHSSQILKKHTEVNQSYFDFIIQEFIRFIKS